MSSQSATPATAPVPAAAAPAASEGQVADLSYRHYDGPLRTRALRWWTISRWTIAMNSHKRAVWACLALGVLIHLVGGGIFYISHLSSQVSSQARPGAEQVLQLHYGDIFYDCLHFYSFFIFLIAIIIGAGNIAADNRANALFVYLSKPLTKGDYLIGKWVGVFLVTFVAALFPAFLLYVFMLCTYWDAGFLTSEKTLILRMIAACAAPALLHTSISLGISACCKNPRTAYGLYAAFYVFVGMIVNIAGTILQENSMGNEVVASTIRHLSVDGVSTALALSLYRIQNTGIRETLAHPALLPVLLVGAGYILIPIVVARAKIRAVEIIKG